MKLDVIAHQVKAKRFPDSADVVAVYGASALKQAIQRADSLNGSEVRQALVRLL